jgi:4-amino-4-deoxy-L-arabinose transferase-like glycosyltransferase
MTRGSRKRTPTPVAPAQPRALGIRDAIALPVLIGIAFLMIAQVGSRRGVELMPWPDALEYAAQAVNIDSGRGPVLHFGGYSYPSRYPEGYPLILAAAAPIVGHEVARFYLVTIAIGLCAIVAIYLLALKLFGRPGAIVTALLLALCPVFITYSALVLSDVPTMAMTILVAYALAKATEEEDRTGREAALYTTWIVLGFIAGFSAIMRPTNAMVVGGLLLALIVAPPQDRNLRRMAIAAGGFVVAFALMPLVQLHTNSVYLGGALRSGYGWWVPEVYSASGYPFSVSHLFGPTLPENPHGNVPVYAMALMGLDGMLGDRGDPRYFLYPFAAAVFAVIGCAAALRDRDSRLARRVIAFGLGLLGLLFSVYAFDLFTETAYLLPGIFIVFVGAGYGAVVANRWMSDVFSTRRRTPAMLAAAAGVVLLDLLLVISLGNEFLIRMSAVPRESEMVQELARVETTIPPTATIVSNISLQFLELYMPGDHRELVGLNSLDPGQTFTDYHLHRLFAKRGLGWTGPIPPVLFIGEAMTPELRSGLAARMRAPGGAYLLLAAPESQEYAATLRVEMEKMGVVCTLEPVIRNRTIALFKLAPRD